MPRHAGLDGGGPHPRIVLARYGPRRGLLGYLAVSALLLIVAVCGILLTPARGDAQGTMTPSANSVKQANTLASPIWDRSHLEANGLEKCRAFRQVVKHTQSLQAVDGGTISAGQARRLQAELNAAKAMPPAALTPMQCGVPL